jgi:hypothetical protein
MRILVKVDRNNQTLTWEHSYPFMQYNAKVEIPVGIRNKILYSVINLGGSNNDKISSFDCT